MRAVRSADDLLDGAPSLSSFARRAQLTTRPARPTPVLAGAQHLRGRPTAPPRRGSPARRRPRRANSAIRRGAAAHPVPGRDIAEQQRVDRPRVGHDEPPRGQMVDPCSVLPRRSPGTDERIPRPPASTTIGVERPDRNAGLDQRDQQRVLEPGPGERNCPWSRRATAAPLRWGSGWRRGRARSGERTTGRRGGSAACASRPRSRPGSGSRASRAAAGPPRGLLRRPPSTVTQSSRSPGNSARQARLDEAGRRARARAPRRITVTPASIARHAWRASVVGREPVVADQPVGHDAATIAPARPSDRSETP